MATKTATKTAPRAATTKTAARAATKTAPRAATKAAPAADETPAIGGKPIEFMGRTMVVVAPGPERMVAWRHTATELQRTDLAPLPNDPPAVTASKNKRVIKLTERAMKLLASILADQDDKDWLWDEFMDGGLTLEGALPILELAGGVWQSQIRQKAPKNGPASKARRR